MTLDARKIAVLTALTAGAFLTGCGTDPACALTPPINDAPTSCTLPPQTTVTVDVRWCNCGSSVVCDVSFDSGFYLLEPRVTSCDAECPGNPTSCGLDDTVSCVFTTEPLGEDNTYSVQIADASGIRNATFTIDAGGDDSCGP